MSSIQDGSSSPGNQAQTLIQTVERPVKQPVKHPVEQPQRSSAYRWRLIAALWVIVVFAAALPSIGASVVNAHMADALHFDRTVIGTGFGVFILMMGAPGPIIAMGVRRVGVKRVILAGTALLAAGTLTMAEAVRHAWQFPLVFGLLVGSGVACSGLLPAQAAVAKWFPDRRALAVSIVFSAIDVGGMIAAPFLEKAIVLDGGEWRAGWYVMSGFALLAFLIAAFAIRRDEPAGEGAVAAPLPAASGPTAPVFSTWREALGERSYWLIMLYMCVVGFDWMLMMAHGVVHLRDSGYSSGSAAFAVSIMVSASLAGNALAGVLGDRFSIQRIGAVAIASLTAGLILAVHPQGAAGSWMFAVPVGLGYGASQVCLMALLGNYFGANVFPQLLGLMMAVGTGSGAFLVGAAGAVFDRTGSYSPVFALCISLSVVATLAVSLAAPPKARETARRPAFVGPETGNN
ncbi:MFS transporter [Paraburkholderia kururiensis]|jgi:cyanate permease|uniref:MFS transporter n=1 Tax=Paraburkholderia kururiensis TaxID=984307 RepID=UPI001F0B9ED3|nr:MFS transporter [Paraburkholderia kururiensis]